MVSPNAWRWIRKSLTKTRMPSATPRPSMKTYCGGLGAVQMSSAWRRRRRYVTYSSASRMFASRNPAPSKYKVPVRRSTVRSYKTICHENTKTRNSQCVRVRAFVVSWLFNSDARRASRSDLFSSGERRIEAMPAARFVDAAGADEHAVGAGDEPLRVVRGVAADDADRERLGDVFRDGQELRHRLERPAQIVLIEAGHDHALPAIRERVARRRQMQIEELPLVDADNLGVFRHLLHDL